MPTIQRLPRLVYIVTHWSAAHWHLRGQLDFMRQSGFDVTLITSGPDDKLNALQERENVRVLGIPMAREINPPVDSLALQRVYSLLKRLAPDIVNASTPKAGLLGMQAAFALRVPARVYMLRGLRLETTSGLKNRILKTTERIASSCSHEVLCTSHSLRQVYLDMGLTQPEKARVLGHRSSNGVDVDRFALQPSCTEEASRIRTQPAINRHDRATGFVGRFNRTQRLGGPGHGFLIPSVARPDLPRLFAGAFVAS